MPGATSGDFWPRVVVDEASFDFRKLPDADVERGLDQFNDALDALRRDGQAPAVYLDYHSVECRDGMELVQLIYARATDVDPDVCRRTGVLLDRCQEWDNDAPAGCTPIDLPETSIPAFSAGYALAMALSGRAVGCLVFPTCPRRGLLTLNGESSAVEVMFFAEASEVHKYGDMFSLWKMYLNMSSSWSPRSRSRDSFSTRICGSGSLLAATLQCAIPLCESSAP